MSRKSMQITFNLDLDELDNVSSKLVKHSKKLNVQKSAVTEMLMERKLTKVLNNKIKEEPGISNSLCSSYDFIELHKLYTNISDQNKVLLEENKNLKAENIDVKSK